MKNPILFDLNIRRILSHLNHVKCAQDNQTDGQIDRNQLEITNQLGLKCLQGASVRKRNFQSAASCHKDSFSCNSLTESNSIADVSCNILFPGLLPDSHIFHSPSA